MGAGQGPESVVLDIRRKTRRKFAMQEKICIVLEDPEGVTRIVARCRREGLAANRCDRWSKDFLMLKPRGGWGRVENRSPKGNRSCPVQ